MLLLPPLLHYFHWSRFLETSLLSIDFIVMMTLKQILLQRWMGAKSQCTIVFALAIFGGRIFFTIFYLFLRLLQPEEAEFC
jgi:hypothetical protein